MKFRTFAAFVAPSVVMMLVFIAFPLVSVFIQSFYITQTVVETVEVETCTPGFLKQTCVTEQKTQPVLGEDGKPLTETQFVGLQSYANVVEPARAWAAISAFDWGTLMTIDFWRALRFTLVFTFVTLPLVIGTGLVLATTPPRPFAGR
jgi:multiple sugar transport system permease protein